MKSLSRYFQKLTLPHVKPVEAPEYIYLKVGRKSERFQLTNITFIEAYGIYCKLSNSHGTTVINGRISDLETLLPSSSFVRIHKSYIVNILAITRVTSKVVWIDKQKLTVGITHRERVHELLKEMR